MTIFRAILLPVLCVLTAAGSVPASHPASVPIAMGFTRKLLDERPTVDSISPNGTGKHKFYSGQWYSKARLPRGGYKDSPYGLVMPMGGEIATASRRSEAGSLPLIDPRRGFYVEFEVALSGNDQDHWPAVWMMPIEHDARQSDRRAGGRKGDEHWVEIDVDEGGFGPGTHGVLIEWTGIWPKYQRKISGQGTSKIPLDRARVRRYGFSYEPRSMTVRWWLDGQATRPHPVTWMPNHRFYIIASAQTHGANKPYDMTIRRITVYTPPLGH